VGFAALSPPFCNGPRLVNPFADPIAGVSLLYGVGARPPPDGVWENRPTNLRTRGRSADWVGSGLTW